MKEEKGSIIVYIAGIILIMLMIAMLHMVLGFIFRDQISIIDALDSSATAALSPATEEIKDTYYYEKLIITDYEVIDGEMFPIEYEWVNNGCQGYAGNYILLDYSSALSNAKDYLNGYLQLNKMNYTVESFSLDIEYDNERYLPVVNARWFTKKPSEWWGYEFGDSGTFTFPNQLIYVRFPRWVKVKVDLTLSMPIPFGEGLANLLDADSTNFLSIKRSYKTEAIKEIKVINPPPLFGWE